MRRKPDIKLANQILNWKPIINRKTGLEITIKWFKNLSDNKICLNHLVPSQANTLLPNVSWKE